VVVELMAGIPATDVGRSLAWYERILGRPPDVRPDRDEAGWHLSEGGRISVMRDPGHAGTAKITLVVEDLDGSLAALAERGIEVGSVETVRGRVRKAVVLDPDGNRLVFAESV
jgi:catechol 2,3-dioxygenase-like lactoylglutathione lyase family enzyme